jgi:uncharacterized protein (TIGR02611 family)
MRTVAAMPRADTADRLSQVRTGRFGAVRTRARATRAGRIAWRVGVTVAGVAVIAVGIVLLPLPGPGWLIIFAGLGILSTEYVWAKRLLGWVRAQVRRWTGWAGAQPVWVRIILGLLTLIVIAAAVVAALFLSF